MALVRYPPAKWEFFLTDRNTTVLAPLDQIAYDRVVTLPDRRIGTCSFRVRVDNNPYINEFANGDRLVIARREIENSRAVMFHGPVVSMEEVGDATGSSVVVNAASFEWSLTKRLVGADANGYIRTGEMAVNTARDVLLKLRADTWGADSTLRSHTGIAEPAFTSEIVERKVSYGPVFFKPAYEVMTELNQLAKPWYDMKFVPTEPSYYPGAGGTSAGWLLGSLVVRATAADLPPPPLPTGYYPSGLNSGGANLGGSRKAGTPLYTFPLFEYGTGMANVESYKRVISNDGLMTRGWNINSNYTSILKKFDSDAYAIRGVHEDVVPSDNENQSARQLLLDAHVAVRKQPRAIIDFQPVPNAYPMYDKDFTVGDTVQFRAYDAAGKARIDSYMKVYGITFNIDNNGNESFTVETVPST